VVELDLRTYRAAQESRILTENLVFYSLEKKPKYRFVFDRSKGAVVKRLASEMTRVLTALPAEAAPSPAPAA
jgi:hypothetical protein